MKITLDTNVLIAAFITRGVCHDLLEHCARHHRLILSEFILGELRDKLLGTFAMEAQEVEAAETLIRSRAEVVTPVALDEPICRDPDDDHVIATAIAGDSACIVTGDDDLLTLGTHAGIAMLSPADFWTFEAEA